MQKQKLSPRQRRVIQALMPGGWVSREALDRAAGASNSPDIVFRLRKKLGDDAAIQTRTVDGVDRDGNPCKPGQYHLTESGRALVAELMKEAI